MAAAPYKPVELSLTIDADALEELEEVKAKLGSDNLTTAIYNAVAIVKQLYDYQRRGYQIVLRKGEQDVERLNLPA
jgi:hypothetical protein